MVSSTSMWAILAACSCFCLVQGQRWGTVRLVGGEDPSFGRLQIYLYNRWGTVCKQWSWTTENSQVVCAQLGYSDPDASNHYFLADSTDINMRIHMRSVSCTSKEKTLLDCSYQEYLSSCDHSDDVYVSCGCLTSPPCPVDAENCPYFRTEIVQKNRSTCPICRCATCPERPVCPSQCKSGKTMFYQGETCRRCKCRPQELPDFIEEPNEIPLAMMLAVVVIMFVIPAISLTVVGILKMRQDKAVKAKAAAAKKAAQQQQQEQADWFGGTVTQC